MLRPRLSSVDQMCTGAVREPHFLFLILLFWKRLAMEEGGFWVSRGQDVCLIIAEMGEIILALKRD